MKLNIVLYFALFIMGIWTGYVWDMTEREVERRVNLRAVVNCYELLSKK